jgi:fibronectin type 3 domain-containing protein
MQKFNPILFLAVLSLLVSGCSQRAFTPPSIPSFTDLKLDQSLPTVKEVRTISSMSEIALEWDPIQDKRIAGYRVFRSTGKEGYKLIETLPDRFTSHYTDKNLSPDFTYTYKISSFTADGRVSLTSTSETAATKGRIQPPPFLEALSGLPDRIKLIWRFHPNTLVNGYIVERLEQGQKEWKRIVVLRDRLTVEYIDKSVKPGQSYTYRLRAKTYDGIVSAPGKEVTASAKQLPQAITFVKASTNVPKAIQLTWSDPNPADTIDHYNIYSSAFRDAVYTFVKSVKDRKFVDQLDRDGYRRYYKVTAVDVDGLESTKGGISAAEGKTLGLGPGPIMHKAMIRNNAVILTWSNADKRTQKYTIVKKYWDGWRIKKIRIVDFTTFVDKKIEANTKYTYYVIGVDRHGIESEPSREIVVSINELN